MQVYVIDVVSGATQEMVTSNGVLALAGRYSMRHVPLPIVILSMSKQRRAIMFDDDDDPYDEIITLVIGALAGAVWAILLFALLLSPPDSHAQMTRQECAQMAADQVKELMALPDQSTQIKIMRRESICKQHDSAFTCYRKLLTKLENTCKSGSLREE